MTAETSTIEAVRIVGGVGTGKTERLVERVAALVADGADPSDVAAFCATPAAARAFAERLRARMGDAAADVHVATPRALALDVLADDEAVAFTGREPRLLADFEEKFLLEDMKVCGLRPRRLREMLKFFHRSWTELADDDPSWLLPGEETDVHALLKANLAFLRAVVEPEAANLAVNYLRAHDEARAAHSWKHVVADDYLRLSLASQTLVEMVAGGSIAVAGDPNGCVETYDSYPYAAGLDAFAERHPDAEETTLTACKRSRATAQAVSRLLADPCMEPADFAADPAAEEGSVEELACESPAQEFERMAALAADEAAAGTPASSIVVAVPNGTWAKNAVAALKARGLRAEALSGSQPIRGDVRDNARCVAARTMTALQLAANPRDAVAWRCWCGYGDYLVNSAAFANLRAYADEAGCGLVEALEAVSGGADASGSGSTADVVGAQRVAEAYRSGRALIERVEGLAGDELLKEIARAVTGDDDAGVPPVLAQLCRAQPGGADEDAPSAAALVERARARLFSPNLSQEDAVAVVPYDLMAGFSPDVLMVTGFVNGFIPCRDYFDATVTPLDKQKKMHAVDARRVHALVGKAGRRLVLSHFSVVDLETSGVLKLKISRIRLRDGVRVCSIDPSEFLDVVMPKE